VSDLVSQNYLTFCVAYICADYVGLMMNEEVLVVFQTLK